MAASNIRSAGYDVPRLDAPDDRRSAANAPMRLRATAAPQSVGGEEDHQIGRRSSNGFFLLGSHDGDRKSRALLLFLAALFVVTVIRTAWVAEDAYIAFRTVDNFINGHGLTWNVSERVQTYTCPLWVLLLSAGCFFTNEFFVTSIALSLLLSFVALGMVIQCGRGKPIITALALLILVLSKAFTDYSTSGLENPLSHVLMGAFLLIYFTSTDSDRVRLFVLSSIASLAAVNRLDLLLIYLPPLVSEVVRSNDRRGVGVSLLLGSLPLVLWESFSLFYYGFPFPNTAYAKLGHGMSRWVMVMQGLRYFEDSFLQDPITLTTILFAVGYVAWTRNTKGLPVAAGIVAYLGYVLVIGGDFMSGRFFSTSLYAAVFTIVACGPQYLTPLVSWSVAGLVIMNGILLDTSPVRSGLQYGADKGQSELISPHGICDERAFYYPVTGLLPTLLNSKSGKAFPNPFPSPGVKHPAQLVAGRVLAFSHHGFLDREGVESERVRVIHNIGIRSFLGGPHIHYIDPLGLGDALEARLPPIENPNPRIGHYSRAVPKGYYATVVHGRNELADPNLAKYYDRLKKVISGPLFDTSRLVEIAKFNLAYYDELIDEETYRFPKYEKQEAAEKALGIPREAMPPRSDDSEQQAG